MDLSSADILRYYNDHAPNLHKSGGELRGRCPLHKGQRDSFAVNLESGTWFCHSQCNRGSDIVGFEMALTGLDRKAARAAVCDFLGRQNGNGAASHIVATYDYTDEHGQSLFQTVRYEPKDFKQRRSDGRSGWIWNLKGTRRILYHLPAVLAASIVFVVEGEKDANALTELGVVATTSPLGAGKWRAEYAEVLRGKEVFVIPDADEKGRAHAADVVGSLQGVAASVKLVELPGAKDAAQWIERGGTLETLIKLAERAPEPSASRHPEPADADPGGPPEAETIKKFCVQLQLTGGFTDERLRAAAHAFNGQCASPLDAAQVNAIVDWTLKNIRSGAGGGQTAPADWEDPIPLQSRVVPAIQAECIPGALGDMVVAVSKATETPLEMPALLGLPVVSCTLAGKIEVDVEPGYREPVAVYVAPAMPSGERKTAVEDEMTRPLTNHESAERRRLEPEIKRAENKRKTIEERITYLRKKAAKSPADATLLQQITDAEESLPDIPRAPQLWTQDVTSERLGQLLADNGERMGLFSDEGDIFEILAGRYNNGAPNFDIVLHGHSGSPVRVSRISRPDLFLERPLLSIGLSPQPGVLERLRDTPAFRSRGLLARFLYALPVSSLGARKLIPHPVPAAVRVAYQELITRLIRLTPPARDGVWQPWRLNFSDEAYTAWKQFQRDVESMMREGGKLERLRDWGSKLPGAVARIAGVFHAVIVEDLPGNLIISGDTIDRSIKLGTALIDHALAVFDLMERDPTFEDAQKILEWIRRGRGQTFTLRECFCAHQSRFKRVAAIRPALALLVEHAYLRRAPKPSVSHRPSEIFEVNRQLLREAT